MALSAAGFDGTIDEISWATLSTLAGTQYAVAGQTDFEVTARPAATLTVNIAAGTAYGHGVKVVSDAQATLALASIASGTRWDAVVLRRDWGGVGGTVSLVGITGTATRGVPAGRLSGPGTLDDQVLALVQLTAGQTQPTAIINMRTWPSKVQTVSDLLAITNPTIGREAVVLGVAGAPDTRWRYQLDATNNPAWNRDTTGYAQHTITPLSQNQVLATSTGWDAFALDNLAIIDGNHVDVWLEFRNEGARLVSDANGSTAPVVACTLLEALWPPKGLPAIPIVYYGGTVGAPTATGVYPGMAALNATGGFSIISLTPNVYMNVRTGNADISVRAHFTFTRRVPF